MACVLLEYLFDEYNLYKKDWARHLCLWSWSAHGIDKFQPLLLCGNVQISYISIVLFS